MPTGQREISLVMIECCGLPCSCAVASGAVVIEVVGLMIWIGDSGKVTAMTGIAVGRRQGITRGMATYTGRACMSTGQRELRS